MTEMDVHGDGVTPMPGRIPADLLELAADVALVGVPSDDVASVILEAHPLPEVFAKLEEAETGGKEESDLCAFLERMFETSPGSELLAHAMPYAEAGLAAESPRVRKLACAQLGRAIAFATSSEGAAPVPDKLLAVLADVLRDSDAGVAAAAATALAFLASAAPETLNPIVARLSSFVVDHRPETRLRAHALASKLASSSLRAAAAVAERGLHDELMREVDDRRDPLAAMAAMELLAELVEAESVETAAALGITGPLLPKLATIVSGGTDGKGREHPGFVRARAAVVGARIAAASATILGELPEAATTTTGTTGSPTFLDALANAVEDDDVDVREAAFVAVGTLCECRSGAAALVAPTTSSCAALLSATVSAATGVGGPTRIAALHAVASLAGAGVSSGRRSTTIAPDAAHEPVGVVRSRESSKMDTTIQDVVLSNAAAADAAETAESAIRDAVYNAAAARGCTPAERFWALLERGGDSFLEVRVAAYRCVAALGRRSWFAVEVTSHDLLLGKIVDASGETAPPGCRWRHEAALGLLAGAEASRGDNGPELQVNDAKIARLTAAVGEGPFGRGTEVTRAIPKVAISRR